MKLQDQMVTLELEKLVVSLALQNDNIEKILKMIVFLLQIIKN
jgi:hypothetical protein